MATVLNFLWINLGFPAEGAGFVEPLPPRYIENARRAAAANPGVEVRLWVDSRRLTALQYAYLGTAAAPVRLMDLRALPAYDGEDLYNQEESNPQWRDRRKHSLIWRQVDAAKVLVSLQGDFERVFFSDFDLSDFAVADPAVQSRLQRHGILVRGAVPADGQAAFENQFWGFTRRRLPFFQTLYKSTLDAAYSGVNGYMSLINQLHGDLAGGEGVDLKEICFRGRHDGTCAYHPGHEWGSGLGPAPAQSKSLPGLML